MPRGRHVAGYGGKTSHPPDVNLRRVGGPKHPPIVGSGTAEDQRLAGHAMQRAGLGQDPPNIK